MVYKLKYFFLLTLIFSAIGQANNVEELMDEYTNKNALSKQTIDANKGHLFLFSRDRLEKMHARTLKDVLKLAPVMKYKENRFGLPDPISTGSIEPFKSNFIRLYIDGVEITQGWLGSGLVLYGDVNIDFADHIEMYLMTTSFETSVEPAYMTIFIYSKDPKRDNGGKMNFSISNNGSNSQSLNIGEVKDGYAYMLNYSHTLKKREKVENGTPIPLSRDYERSQLFGYIKSENQIFHLQVMKKETDSLAGFSWDASPYISQMDYLNLHIDYGANIAEHWHVQFAYDWLQTDAEQVDDMPLAFFATVAGNSLYATYKNSTYSGEITYKNTIGKHRITTGLKGRLKSLDSLSLRGMGNLPISFDKESVLTLFFQDQCKISERELLTVGLSYAHYVRNDNIQSDDLLQARLGYIYNGEKWGYKTYLSRTMFTMDPFSRQLIDDTSIDPQTTIGFTQEFTYTSENNDAKLTLMYIEDKDAFVQTIGSGESTYFFTMFNDEYSFDTNNKVSLQLFYGYYKDIFDMDHLEGYGGYLSFINSYGIFDFYNNVVWQKYSIDKYITYDWTSSISWEATRNLTFILKGQNLLDNAQDSAIIRVNPLTGTLSKPLKYQLTDRRVLLEMEYTF